MKGNWSSINFNKMLNILIWQDSKKVLVVVFFFFSRLCVPTRIRHGVNEFLRNSSTHFDSIQSITVLDHATSSSTYLLFFFLLLKKKKKFWLDLGSVWIGLIFLKLKTYCWNHCSKIIFKCVNNTVGPIFNEKIDKKWNLWIRE